MNGLKNSYSHFPNLLKSRGFIEIMRVLVDGQEKIVFEYGPLGTSLRQNIVKQWWDKMIHQQMNVFPTESSILHVNPSNSVTYSFRFQNTDAVMRRNLRHGCLRKYLQALKLTNKRLPLSVASIGCCASVDGLMAASQSETRSLLMGGAFQTRLTLQNFIPPVRSNSVLDYWLQLRLSWWKQFSRNPSKFSVQTAGNGSPEGTEIGDNKTNVYSESNLNIVYEFPWGQEIVEEVKNLGDEPFRNLPDKEIYLGKNTGNKSVLPYCIECDTSLESAMAAWLIDSYHERTHSKSKKKMPKSQVLQLHPLLAPFQVAIVMPSSFSSTSSSSASASTSSPLEIRHICNFLEQGLRDASVSVFNTSTHGGSIEAHYRRNDELGIPYTVLVNQNTIIDGLVSVRNRDTQVKTSHHISTLIENFTKNLQAQLE